MRLFVMVFLATAVIAGCAPEVGSKSWCEQMDEKSKGDWTVNEAESYVRNCIVRPND
jgi:hypothetical protein